MKIKTSHDTPPIPDRNHDWSAIDDDTYDAENSPIGHGPTERKAIFDLMMQIFPDETLSFMQKMTDVHQRIIERERAEIQLRQSPYRDRRLTDDEHDDDMFSQENGDGPVY